MIDKKLYCETFSRLHASEEAKKEVFQMTKKKGARIPKLLRGAAIAAAMTMALAVTAGRGKHRHRRGVLPAVYHCLDRGGQHARGGCGGQ